MECVWGVRLIRHGYGLAMWDEEKRRRVMAAPCGPRTMGLFFLWCLMACPPELGGNLLTLKVRILKHWRIFILFYILLREILPPPPPGGASGKDYAYHCRRRKRYGFEPWVRKIPRSRKWQPAPIFLPGNFHRQRSLASCSLWGHKEPDMTEYKGNLKHIQ